MISGNEHAIEQFYVNRIGADDFMKKPFSRFEIFARVESLLDDDMVVERSAVVRHLGHSRDAARILMGPYDVHSDNPDIIRAFWWYEERHRRLAADSIVRDPHDAAFANTSAPTTLLRAHPFDERFRGYGLEDYELAVRLLAAGEVIMFDPQAAIAHHLSPSRSESLRKMREEGVNRMLFLAIHPSYEHVILRANPGRAERILRRVARLPVSTSVPAVRRRSGGHGR